MSTSTFRFPLNVENDAPFALMRSIGAPTPVRCAAAKLGVGSFAATLIAPVADAGEPVMYRPAPLLPAEATTMIPAFAAFVDATASGFDASPNGEPRDMLITSMPLSTAQSIASTTTFVEPAQPNTRIA